MLCGLANLPFSSEYVGYRRFRRPKGMIVNQVSALEKQETVDRSPESEIPDPRSGIRELRSAIRDPASVHGSNLGILESHYAHLLPYFTYFTLRY